jgi:hypothetical protein
MPQVSVIIPTYNRAGYVVEAIDSVLAQTFNEHEIIVVDDGSTDNTKEVLAKYGDRLRYIYQANAGVSSARNHGIQEAKADWIAFLDSDDIWFPEKLAVQMEFVHKYPDVVLHTVNVEVPEEEHAAANSFGHCGFTPGHVDEVIEKPFLTHFKYRTLVMPPAVMVKKGSLIQAGLFDTQLSICEDYDLMCRMALQGKWGVTNQVLAKAFRREEGTPNLSQQRRKRAHVVKLLIGVHTGLLEGCEMMPCEQQYVKRLLSGNYREMIVHYKRDKLYREAMQAAMSAMKHQSDPLCVAKCVASMLFK